MMKVMVVYDSKFGNTEKIALALAEGMKSSGLDVDCARIDNVDRARGPYILHPNQ